MKLSSYYIVIDFLKRRSLELVKLIVIAFKFVGLMTTTLAFYIIFINKIVIGQLKDCFTLALKKQYLLRFIVNGRKHRIQHVMKSIFNWI